MEEAGEDVEEGGFTTAADATEDELGVGGDVPVGDGVDDGPRGEAGGGVGVAEVFDGY